MSHHPATTAIRNRIKRHARVRAGDLVPHELNPRTHSEAQRQALAALYEQIGFARSVLAYELPDGRLKLIDGHLRRGMDPDMLLDVEVLDVDDAEARALLLSLDPLAALADYDAAALDVLRQTTATDNAALANLWAMVGQANQSTTAALADAAADDESTPTNAGNDEIPEQWQILVTCKDEAHQLKLLADFTKKGLPCKALIS